MFLLAAPVMLLGEENIYLLATAAIAVFSRSRYLVGCQAVVNRSKNISTLNFTQKRVPVLSYFFIENLPEHFRALNKSTFFQKLLGLLRSL